MAMTKAEILPQEIIIDILSRLPAKFIGQFRCVSKQWRHFLSDPQFIKFHFSIHNKEEKLICISRSHSLNTITFTHNITDGILRKLNFQQLSDNWVRIFGSCNGLVLVENEEKILFLINPTTLKYHKIPIFHFARQIPGSFSVSGLGYDFANDDYKVVTLSHYYYEHEPDIRITFIDIYSVRKGLWRRLENLPYDLEDSLQTSGVLVNGALHWLVSKLFDDSFVVVAFDLSYETFLEMPTPTTIDNNNVVCYDLVAVRGCLCMFTDTEENRIDAWMMKEYGVEDSWTKFSITVPKSLYGFIPLCLISDDDVVLDGEKLIVYNMKEEQWRDMKVDGVTAKFRSTRTFVESLVSPIFGKGTEGYSIA
ncbi:PREDICTED: F-box/kelch-repeat protein At3g06240-like [Nicotiana attenuata]|uniref:F-boxkelch-repeat protein n=1 Tax=Nicotiana attenuata TaxID=49451 RepID=A0A1J6KDC7_NICAT|nr:PREDICTED: F-box/kelch-repeat protein At3g06240-like [Nicotiana attenuata]OIT28093.1 f-boxkelch-repeat protein [Nicotiana attenuata]